MTSASGSRNRVAHRWPSKWPYLNEKTSTADLESNTGVTKYEKNLKIKMTDGRHIENRFFAISQQPVVQYQ